MPKLTSCSVNSDKMKVERGNEGRTFLLTSSTFIVVFKDPGRKHTLEAVLDKVRVLTMV